MIKSRIETLAGLTELNGTELDLVTGGVGGSSNPSWPPPGGGNQSPPPTGGGLASLGSDFSKLYADLRAGASFSTIRSDYRAILHDAGVGGF
jgi:hypothetical protein